MAELEQDIPKRLDLLIHTSPTLKEILSEREFQICGFLTEGMTDREISAELEVSEAAVSQAGARAMNRLGLTKRVLIATRYTLERYQGYYEGT